MAEAPLFTQDDLVEALHGWAELADLVHPPVPTASSSASVAPTPERHGLLSIDEMDALLDTGEVVRYRGRIDVRCSDAGLTSGLHGRSPLQLYLMCCAPELRRYLTRLPGEGPLRWSVEELELTPQPGGLTLFTLHLVMAVVPS